ncbi:MAG: hypothetical protein DRN26_00075 [Thermoplasmata archaeon]|nr:MAG: hypothetical protein DRN26_00075 [Thermoplasmata archaeon]
MSGWMYRLGKRVENGYVIYEVIEAYYNDDHKIWGVTTSPVSLQVCYANDDNEAKESFAKMLERIRKDLEMDIIDLDKIRLAESPFSTPTENPKKEEDHV